MKESITRPIIKSTDVSYNKRQISKLGYKTSKSPLSGQQKELGYSLTKKKIQDPFTATQRSIARQTKRSLAKVGYRNEGVDVYSKWSNEEPIKYAKYLTQHFGSPDELTDKRAVWYNKDGFKRIEVLDEYILHSSPSPHYDFVYCYIDKKVPHELAEELANSSESILIDFLKNEVGARCGSLSANAVTLQYVMDVVDENVKPSEKEYGKRITQMKDMFASGKRFKLDWWPDEAGDTDPKNPYYNESAISFFDFRKKLNEATYKGKKVPLNKPMAGDVKKSKVFVDPDGDGKAQKVNFGDKSMTIKKHIPSRRKSFRARHNCDNPGPKTKARYWSCRAW